ncbi:MAG TPA: DUF4265 domain-containing protein [Capsulimonadaceae bacterium]
MTSNIIEVRLSAKEPNGDVFTENVPASHLAGDRYLLLASPGFVGGAAAGDEVQLISQALGTFRVLRRGGNISIQVFFNDSDSAKRNSIADAVDKIIQPLGGRVDGGADSDIGHLLVLTVPFIDNFAGIESAMGIISSRFPVERWMYGNVFDDRDGTTPLNWWHFTLSPILATKYSMSGDYYCDERPWQSIARIHGSKSGSDQFGQGVNLERKPDRFPARLVELPILADIVAGWDRYELVPAMQNKPGIYRIVASPGFAPGISSGDMIELKPRMGRYTVIRRSGNITVQAIVKAPTNGHASLERDISKRFAAIGGWIDGAKSGIDTRLLVFTVPVVVGFRVIDILLAEVKSDYHCLKCTYSNVFDTNDGVTPLNWWI